MTDLQKEFEATGYTSWINADLYPDGKIYTQEYTQWLEKQVLALRQPPVSGSLPSDDRIVTEAIQVARKMDTEVGLLPSNNDIKMFCLGAKWMRDWVQSNDR